MKTEKNWGNLYFGQFKLPWKISINSVYFIAHLTFKHGHDQCFVYLEYIKIISELKGQTWWRYLGFISILISVKYFWILLLRKPHDQLFIYILITGLKQSSSEILFRFELFNFYVDAFKSRNFAEIRHPQTLLLHWSTSQFIVLHSRNSRKKFYGVFCCCS